jgi:hypothetical protein
MQLAFDDRQPERFIRMTYLQPADYAAFGLSAETADAWVTAASAMMESYCRRPSLMAVSYTERMRVPLQAQSVRLSYTPLVSITGVRARYAAPSHDEYLCDDADLLSSFASAFVQPHQWVEVDPTTLDVSLSTGEFRFAANMIALRYAQTEVTYMAGLTVVPDQLKVACAQIVKNAQATPGLNVKSSKMDTLQTQYFSDSLIDSQVKALLRPYVAERLG